jgi:transcriptional regulator with XRE-family HTH domain
MDTNTLPIGPVERLKAARKARGLSLAEVAEGSGLLRSAVARAERSDVDPRISTVIAFAKALGLPLCEIVDKNAKHGPHAKRRSKARD